MGNQYGYSFCEEVYEGRHDSPEAAADEAFAVDEDAMNVFVGQLCEPTSPERYLDADAVIELIKCQDDYNLEVAEDWPAAGQEQKDELTEDLRRAFVAWMDRHNLRPTHYVVDQSTVQEICRMDRPDS